MAQSSGKSSQSEILATLAGLGSLAGFSFLGFPLAFSGIAGVGIYMGLKLLTYKSPKLLKIESLPPQLQTSVKTTQDLILKANTKSQSILDLKAKQTLEKIIDLGQKVIQVVIDENNSSETLREVQKLFISLNELLDKYLDLSQHQIGYQKLNSAIKDFQILLIKIESALEKYYKQGLNSDVQSFQIDMKVVSTKLDTLSDPDNQ